jgi:HEAT repeats
VITTKISRRKEHGQSLLPCIRLEPSVCVLIAFLALAQRADAFPRDWLNWSTAFADSDVVCKAVPLTSAVKPDARNDVGVTVRVAVQTVFKGTLDEGETPILIPWDPAWPGEFPDVVLDPENGPLVLFLDESDDGLRPALPPPSFIRASRTDVPCPRGDVDSDGELSLQEGKEWLWHELYAAVNDYKDKRPIRPHCNRGESLTTLVKLGVLPDETDQLLEELSHDRKKGLAGGALRLRIERQDIEALAEALDALAAGDSWTRALPWALGKVRTPEAVPLLGRALKYDDPKVRYYACEALRHILADEVAPLLIEAIDDSDLRVAHTALVGLYHLERKEDGQPNPLPGVDFAPGPDFFEKDPDKYRENWRAWWTTTGRAKYAHLTEQPSPQ